MSRPTFPRRRIVLMRQGSAAAEDPDAPPAAPRLSAEGERNAEAAGALLAACGVRFDRVVTSGRPPAVQTARRVLHAARSVAAVEHDAALEDVRGGPQAALAPEMAELAFLSAASPVLRVESQRFLGGESVGELLDRVLPAFDAWLAREDWRCLLMVLGDAVARALLSTALVGGRAFLNRLEQQPACLNVIDLPGAPQGCGGPVVRAVNLEPARWLKEGGRGASMDELLLGLRHAAIGTVEPTLPR